MMNPSAADIVPVPPVPPFDNARLIGSLSRVDRVLRT